jgi:hypothetical protein
LNVGNMFLSCRIEHSDASESGFPDSNSIWLAVKSYQRCEPRPYYRSPLLTSDLTIHFDVHLFSAFREKR